MTKVPFAFHSVGADWGQHLPAGDYTVGRGADPRSEAARRPASDTSLAQTRPDQANRTDQAGKRRPSAAE